MPYVKYRTRKITVRNLIQMGIDVKICAHCKKPMHLREIYYENVPAALLFVNKVLGIYVLLHRKCKKKYTARLLKNGRIRR